MKVSAGTLPSATIRGEELGWAVSSCLSWLFLRGAGTHGVLLAQRGECVVTALWQYKGKSTSHKLCWPSMFSSNWNGSSQNFVAETLFKMVNSFLKPSLSGHGSIAALPALGRQRQNQESLRLARSAGDPILKTKPNPKYSTLLYST